MAAVVEGYTGLMRALARSEREVRLDVRQQLREVAEPIADNAERLAVEEISRIGPKWSRMRVGVTTKAVYVAPRERGVRSRGLKQRKRPNLAGKLMDEAMEPALEANANQVEARVERALERMANTFSR